MAAVTRGRVARSQIGGWPARLPARRGLRRLCGQLLERVGAEVGDQRSPPWR